MSQDPVFWHDPAQQDLMNPQSLNSYSYGNDNPISNKDPQGTSVRTAVAGFFSPATYAYHNPGQAALVLAAGIGLAAAAPVAAAAVTAAALGGYAIGTAGYNAVTAPDADTRDYYLGQGTSATLLTGMGIRATGSLTSTANTTEGVDVSGNATAVHGNSLNSPKLNYGYQLIDRDTGEVLKYGITGNDNPYNRYTKSQYEQMNAQMKIVNQGSRRDMHTWEAMQIKTHEAQTGTRPALNKTYH